MNKEMRISDDELALIKALFADNPGALKLLRKVFLPEITFTAPLGQQVDLWMTLKIEDLSPEQALINLKARNTVIQHVEGCLMQLNSLAGMKEESVEDTKKRLAKNSTK